MGRHVKGNVDEHAVSQLPHKVNVGQSDVVKSVVVVEAVGRVFGRPDVVLNRSKGGSPLDGEELRERRGKRGKSDDSASK
jgi:hypothetical protein